MAQAPSAPDSVAPHSAETQVAFYKLLKFWVVFLLAVMAAAAVWRLLQQENGDAAPPAQDASVSGATVSYMR